MSFIIPSESDGSRELDELEYDEPDYDGCKSEDYSMNEPEPLWHDPGEESTDNDEYWVSL